MADISKISLSGAEYDLKDGVARQGLTALETAQRALGSLQEAIVKPETRYVLTEDTNFLRYKKYYSKSGDNYTELVLGTDYFFGGTIEADTIYEYQGPNSLTIFEKLNEAIDVINTIIPAHRVIEPE